MISLRLLDLKEPAQIVGANHADFADLDEGKLAAAH
jgi:hypothetical protein